MIADEEAAAMSELAHCIAKANGVIAARLTKPMTVVEINSYAAFLRRVIVALETLK